MMYYCIKCQAVHEILDECEEVYLTGFHFIDGEKMPAGVCRRNLLDSKADKEFLSECRSANA